MTGLLLLGVLGLWFAFSVFVALKLFKFCRSDKTRLLVLVVVLAVMLPLPVADELIAAPQFRQMCKEGTTLKFDPESIVGTTVYRQPSKFPFPKFSLVGLTGYYVQVTYTATPTGKPVIAYRWFSIDGGMLIRLLGISETKAPLTFSGSCRPTEEPWEKTFLSHYNLTIIEIKDK